MKKFFKKIINKLIRLIYGKNYIIREKAIEEPIVKTEKEIYFEKLAENRGRIIELMGRTDRAINEDLVKIAIQEDLKISAIKYNDWKTVYNKIKGFNDPSDELRRLIAQDNLGDRISLQRKAIKLDNEGITIIRPNKKSKSSKLPKAIVDAMTRDVSPNEGEISLEEVRKIDDLKQEETSKVMNRILESKNKIIK